MAGGAMSRRIIVLFLALLFGCSAACGENSFKEMQDACMRRLRMSPEEGLKRLQRIQEDFIVESGAAVGPFSFTGEISEINRVRIDHIRADRLADQKWVRFSGDAKPGKYLRWLAPSGKLAAVMGRDCFQTRGGFLWIERPAGRESSLLDGITRYRSVTRYPCWSPDGNKLLLATTASSGSADRKDKVYVLTLGRMRIQE